jgi:hypothetical protein
MFTDVECPNPAYNRIIESGVAGRIKRKKSAIGDVLLYNSIYEGGCDWILKRAEREMANNSELREVFRDILILEKLLEEKKFDFEGREKIMIEHPSFLGYLVLEDEIIQPQKFGFPSRRKLEEAISSFCIGERHLFSTNNVWVWRNGSFKNEIYLNLHGDLYGSQRDVSGNYSKTQGLFGVIEEFDAVKEIGKSSTIYSHQDWSGLLISLLRYAEAIGLKDMPEIRNWRGVLDKIGGGVGTNTAEYMFGKSSSMFGKSSSSWVVHDLKERTILTSGRITDSYPLHLPCRELEIFPYINGRNLIFMTKSKEGEKLEELKGTELEDYRFARGIIYNEQDLPDALKATYKFFARDRSLLPKIMGAFLDD